MILQRLLGLAALSLAIFTPGLAITQTPTAAPKPPGYAEKDLREMIDLFAGHWNNERQSFFAPEAGLDASTLAPRQHWQVSAGSALRTTDLTISDPEGITQRLNTTWEVRDTGTITQTFTLAGPEARGPQLGCEIVWRRFGGQFQGTASGGECARIFSSPEGPPAESITLSLSPNELWISAIAGNKTLQTRLRRARVFTCWTALMRGASHGDDTRGMNDWQWQEGLVIHDQGGEVVITSDEPSPRLVRLKLRLADWTYGTRRPSLTLYVHEGSDDRAVSYAWADGEAERVGINLRWLQASCTYSPDAAATTNAETAMRLGASATPPSQN